MKTLLYAFALGLALSPMTVRAALDIEPYLRKDRFEEIKLSPSGEYLALTAPLEDRTVLVVMRRADKQLTAKLTGGKNTVVSDFWWVNDERVVASMAEKFGTLDRPSETGELHAVNADGSGGKLLVQHNVDNYLKGDPLRAAYLISTYEQDAKQVLIGTNTLSATPQTQVELLNVYTGRRAVLAKAPVPRSSFAIDANGRVRFALGAEGDNASKLYYRADDAADWQLLNDENSSHHVEVPLGFSADGSIAYLQVEQDSGPDALVGLSLASGERRVLLRDAEVDPYRVIRDPVSGVPVGCEFMKGRPENRFFDEEGPIAQRYRMLERAFEGKAVMITSSSRDGKLNVVKVWDDRNPGDVYLFDVESRRAERLFSYREWFDSAKMAGTEGVQLDARDGLRLHAYLTRPAGAAADARLPLVLVPHGGPFGIFDTWGFDDDVQMLAAAGYAVLRVNYRGSGNYGRAFLTAGAGEWGGKMQDDLTDATRWAIAQGIADPERICIYGGSYGGYAALMGVAKESDLYRCAVGYVGVYDLPILHDNESGISRWVGRWADDWLGKPEQLAATSPDRLAERIKAPVFLAAGGADETAPIRHSELMAAALEKHGTPVETLYFPNEGHGFYDEAHRREFYTRLLAFLGRHLHAAPAAATP